MSYRLGGIKTRTQTPPIPKIEKKNVPACTRIVHAKKSYNITSKMIAIVFWMALCDAIRRDFSKK